MLSGLLHSTQTESFWLVIDCNSSGKITRKSQTILQQKCETLHFDKMHFSAYWESSVKPLTFSSLKVMTLSFTLLNIQFLLHFNVHFPFLLNVKTFAFLISFYFLAACQLFAAPNCREKLKTLFWSAPRRVSVTRSRSMPQKWKQWDPSWTKWILVIWKRFQTPPWVVFNFVLMTEFSYLKRNRFAGRRRSGQDRKR